MTDPARPGGWPQSRLAQWAARGGATALVAALDHLLEQNAWARERLAPHAGRHIMVRADAPALPGLPEFLVIAVIGQGGRLSPVPQDDASAPAVTIRFRPSVDAGFDLLRGGTRALSRHLRLEGDVMLAGALGEIAPHLRWDAVEDLSRITGDIAAERIARTARSGLDALRDAGTRFQSGAARYLSVESGRLANRGSLSIFAARLDALEQRVAALTPPAPFEQ